MSREELKLKLNNADIDAFPFINTPFDITVYLSDSNDQLFQGNIDIPLQVSLCGDDNKPVDGADSIICISPGNVSIGKSGTATLRVTLKKLSMAVGNKKFKLLVSASTVKEYYIKPVSSPLLTCVLYKLCVSEENSSQFVWFKDEGGREKCIELSVSLRNSAGEIVRRRKVKLKMTLCYSSGVEVSREAQKILTMPEDSSAKIISEDSGETTVRYRINEVSKTHQSQAFCVLISPDVSTSPMNADIAPCTSTPVEVRSKRNNTNKRGRDSASSTVFDVAGVMSVSASGSMSNLNAMGQQIPASVGGDPAPKKGKTGSQPYVLGATDCAGSNAYITELNKIVNWNNNVIEKLQEMQWKGPIGYSDGGPGNPKVPMYNIPNPIESINQLLRSYEENVIASTNYLMSLSGGEPVGDAPLVGHQKRQNNSYGSSDIDPYHAPLASISAYIGGGVTDFTSAAIDQDTGDLASSSVINRNHSLFTSELNRGSSCLMPIPMFSSTSFMDGPNSSSAAVRFSSIGLLNGDADIDPTEVSASSSALEASTYSILPVPYTLVENDLSSSSKSSVNVNRLVGPSSSWKDQGRSLGCPSFNGDNKLIGFAAYRKGRGGNPEYFFIEAHPISDRTHRDDATNVLLNPAEITFLEKKLLELERKVAANSDFLVSASTAYDTSNHDKLYRLSTFNSLITMLEAVVVFVECKYHNEP
jgi:hypothetical protein